jgi:hypothetical protein
MRVRSFGFRTLSHNTNVELKLSAIWTLNCAAASSFSTLEHFAMYPLFQSEIDRTKK